MCLLGSRPNVSFLYHQLLHRQSSFPCLLSVLFGLMDFDLFQPNLRSGPGTHKTPPSWLRVLSGKSGASFLSSSLHRSSMFKTSVNPLPRVQDTFLVSVISVSQTAAVFSALPPSSFYSWFLQPTAQAALEPSTGNSSNIHTVLCDPKRTKFTTEQMVYRSSTPDRTRKRC